MADTKAEWRERLLRARRSIGAGARRMASASVVERLAVLPAFLSARSVLLYDAIGAELDARPLAPLAWRLGKLVYRPAEPESPPAWRIVTQPTDASAIGDDAGSEARVPEIVDRPQGSILLVAPGVGFDLRGGRLGRGRGYYDRAIGRLRRAGGVTVVGVGYDLQLVDALPRDPWDEDVDLIVTDGRVLGQASASPVRALASRPRGGTT
jgi:5-formyltetrahydrofolate cyclo-ligase